MLIYLDYVLKLPKEGKEINRNNEIVTLYETVYETLGKAWPSCKETQDKYCIEFISHCGAMFPVQCSTIQLSMLSTLNLFVNKLTLLTINNVELSIEDRERLSLVCDILSKILRDSICFPGSTRIRKEALNIALSVGKKLRLTNNNEQFNKMVIIIEEALPELTKDNEPEIRTRIIDIKEMLKI